MAVEYHMYSTALVNQFEINNTCIEFVINNVSRQGNVKIKLNFKVEKICRDCSPNYLWNKWQTIKILFSLIRGIFTSLWSTYYKAFCKKVNGWIQSTIFTESCILHLSLGSEYVSHYLEAFSIIINWCFHFESFINFPNLISILRKYLQSNAKYLEQSLFLSIEPTKGSPHHRWSRLAGQFRVKTTLLLGEWVKRLCSNIFCTWLSLEMGRRK